MPSSTVPIGAALLALFIHLGIASVVFAEITEIKDQADGKFSFHGQLKNETAYRFVEPAAFDKILNLARLEFRYTPSSVFSLTAVGRSYYDAVYDFESVDDIVPRKNPRTILLQDFTTAAQVDALKVDNLRDVEIVKKRNELRELYADIALGQLDLRIGKQIVRWGVVEGSRVIDEINPLDFQEWILREIQDRYIPVWMLKADYYFTNYTLEFLSIPDLEFHKPAPRGSEWEQFQQLENLQKPADNFKNTEWALKVSKSIGGWDFSLSDFYMWDQFPTAFRSVFDLGEFGVSPDVNFRPRYTRLNVVGGTFTKGLEGWVFNGELAFVSGKRFGTRFGRFDPTTGTITGGDTLIVTLGELQRNYLKSALSVDYKLFGADVSLQAQTQYIPKYDSKIIQPQLDSAISVFARKEIYYNRMLLEMLDIYFVSDRDWLIRPKATYRVTDAFKIAFGADLFVGGIGGPLPGEFHFAGFFINNDRVYLEFTYSF